MNLLAKIKPSMGYSRDYTYIDNVIQANELAAITPSEAIRTKLKAYFSQEPRANSQQPIMEVFNVAYGKSTTLFELYDALRENLAKHDPAIAKIEVKIGSKRAGDIPHSLASVDKTKMVLEYMPRFDATQGFEAACEWYYENLK